MRVRTDICLVAAEEVLRTRDISWTGIWVALIGRQTILTVDDTIAYGIHWNTSEI